MKGRMMNLTVKELNKGISGSRGCDLALVSAATGTGVFHFRYQPASEMIHQ